MTGPDLQSLITLLHALETDTNSLKVRDASRLVRRAALARLSRLRRDRPALDDPRQGVLPLVEVIRKEVTPP